MRADLAWRSVAALVALALIGALLALLPQRHGCAGIGHAMTLGCR